MTLKNVGLSFAVLALSHGAFAQKKFETSAAVERNKSVEFQRKQDWETAKKHLLAAKEFIDKAASHEDTKNSQKTLWLKGDIYASLEGIARKTGDQALLTGMEKDGMGQAITALKQGYSAGKRYKSDISETVDRARMELNAHALKLFEEGKFNEAAKAYHGQAGMAEAVNMFDTTAVFSEALCHEKAGQHLKAATLYSKLAEVNYRGNISAILASSAYRRAKEFDKAKAVIALARENAPTDRDLLLESVNTSIDEGDAKGAQDALNSAIATDPNNKQLHYTIGTIYIELGENEKAERALNKALELDPDFIDAQYQLGAHLVTWAGNLKTEANKLQLGDSNYDQLIKKSEETYERAVIPLEKYINSFPEEKAVLNILYQLHRNLGNKDKATDYKKRAESAK